MPSTLARLLGVAAVCARKMELVIFCCGPRPQDERFTFIGLARRKLIERFVLGIILANLALWTRVAFVYPMATARAAYGGACFGE